MPAPAASDPLLQAIASAIDAEDMARVTEMVDAHDRQVRAIAAAAGNSPTERERLLDLQRQQVALIELLRNRRDAIADQLLSAGRVGKATRAYLSEGEP